MENDELFSLVQSMGVAERRYFSIWADLSRKGEKYMGLYQSLCEGKEAKVGEKDAYTRHYLYSQILKCLRAFHAGKSPEMELSEGISEVEILSARGLYRQAGKRLKRVYKLAQQLEAFPYLYIIRDWEKKLLKRTPGRFRIQTLNELQKEEQDWNRMHAQELELQNINDQLFLETRFKTETNNSFSNPLDKLPASDQQIETFEGKILFHLIHGFSAQRNAEHEKSLFAFKSILSLWEGKPERMAIFPFRYALSVADYLSTCHLLQRYDDFPHLLEKVKNTAYPDPETGFRAERTFFNLELIYQMNNGLFSEAEKLIQEKGEKITEGVFPLPMPVRISFWLNFSIVHFMRENFSAAHQWLNRILNQPPSDTREDLLRFVHIMRLIILLEIGDLDYFHYIFSSTRRALRKWFQHDPFGADLLKLFRVIEKLPGAEWQKSFQKIDAKWTKEDASFIGYNEILIWIHSRANGLPMEKGKRVGEA